MPTLHPRGRRAVATPLVSALLAGIVASGALGMLAARPAPVAAETAVADVSILAGPGWEYDVLGAAPAGGWMSVDGEAVNGFVPVTSQGTSGWVEAWAVGPDQSATAAQTTDGGSGEWVPEGDDAAEGDYAGDYAAEPDYSAEGEYVPEGEYAAEGESVPEPDYAAEAEWTPEGEYAAEGGYAVEGEYAAEPAPQDGYATGETYAAEPDSTAEGGYAVDGTYAADDSGVVVSEDPVTSEAAAAPSGRSGDPAPPAGQDTSAGGDSEYGNRDIVGIIKSAARTYGQNPEAMLRVARCESGLNPYAVDASGSYYGLFQFVPSTFAGTPYGDGDIFDPVANANAAAWMWEQGRKGEWVCQ